MTREEFDEYLRHATEDYSLEDGRRLTVELLEHDPVLAEKNQAVVRAVEELVAYARARLERKEA